MMHHHILDEVITQTKHPLSFQSAAADKDLHVLRWQPWRRRFRFTGGAIPLQRPPYAAFEHAGMNLMLSYSSP
jgi:hypothetical protein